MGLTKEIAETSEGRIGSWLQTSLGGRFYPLDPRPEEIFIQNIGNGLAQEFRYGGQGWIDRLYTVAEHSCHLSDYVMREYGDPLFAWAMHMHDGTEGLGLKDLPRSVKRGAGAGYRAMEANCERVMFGKYQLTWFVTGHRLLMKELDERIVPTEKAVVMEHDIPWRHDELKPLAGVEIQCWSPVQARREWLLRAIKYMTELGLPKEEIAL